MLIVVAVFAFPSASKHPFIGQGEARHDLLALKHNHLHGVLCTRTVQRVQQNTYRLHAPVVGCGNKSTIPSTTITDNLNCSVYARINNAVGSYISKFLMLNNV